MWFLGSCGETVSYIVQVIGESEDKGITIERKIRHSPSNRDITPFLKGALPRAHASPSALSSKRTDPASISVGEGVVA
jgi:hypothetical protein